MTVRKYTTIATCIAALILPVLPSATAQSATFEHVVIVFQENRSPDNLFGSNPTFEKGVDIATSGVNSKGKVIPLTPGPLAGCYDTGHSHSAWEGMYHGGKMDGADKIPVVGQPKCNLPPNPQFAFVDNSTGAVQPYFDIAERYGFANRMFQTNQGPSFPAHQFIFGGTSAPSTHSKLFASENLIQPKGANAGCIAPPSSRVRVIDPQGRDNTHPLIYPCFEHPTLADLLDAAGLSWKYYTPSAGSIWTAPNAIRHACGKTTKDGRLVCGAKQWRDNLRLSPSLVLSDVQACQLANVVWVMPSGQQSDHSVVTNGTGPQWVASIVNAIGNQPACSNGETYWKNTAVLITWDDWGGWYDHVPPFRIGQPNGWGTGYAYGFRVPLLVVSAFTPAGYVDNENSDFGTLLRFVEVNFGLGNIGPGTYADAYPRRPLQGFFSLTAPRSFEPIPSKLGPSDFIKLRQPMVDPDDDGDGD